MNWHLSFQMHLGEVDFNINIEGDKTPLAIIGPNGSGKSTLLRTMAGAFVPDAGQFKLGERILFDDTKNLFVPPELRRVGYVPQSYALFPHLNVLENVQFGLAAQKPTDSKEQHKQAAQTQLETLHAAHLAKRWPMRLSGGEKQKVALARALVTKPEILLLDEPLSALDATSRRQIRAYLSELLNKRTSPTIFVTQDVRDIEALKPQIIVLDQGTIIQQGNLEELKSNPVNDFVAEFFHA